MKTGAHCNDYQIIQNIVRPLIERLRIEKEDRVRGQIGSAPREMTGEKFAHNYDKV